jgi:hypothetical protein
MDKNRSHFSGDRDGNDDVKYVFDADLKRFPVETHEEERDSKWIPTRCAPLARL